MSSQSPVGRNKKNMELLFAALKIVTRCDGDVEAAAREGRSEISEIVVKA